jgi:N-acetylglutamate synthase-like GNAT family acetyltransferase
MSRTILADAACAELIGAHVETYRGRRDTDRLVLLRCVVMNPFWADPGVRAQLVPQLVEELRQAIPQPAVTA